MVYDNRIQHDEQTMENNNNKPMRMISKRSVKYT